MEWNGKVLNAEMRSLAKAHDIVIKRQQQSSAPLFREAVCQHLEAAIRQEKGCLACFKFNIAKGDSEHVLPLPEEAKHAITAAGTVDIATLRRFRRQNTHMPEYLKGAINRIAGGRALDQRHVIKQCREVVGSGFTDMRPIQWRRQGD